MNNLSGIMHCWFAAKIEVGGENFVCLRGVNFLNEYRTQPRADEKGNRAHQSIEGPWLHVPCTSFPYDIKAPPSAQESAKTAFELAKKAWPFLKTGKIVYQDQDLTGFWGAHNQAGEIEGVTRIAIDLGTANHLPDPRMKPAEKLPWPRHPVFWVKARAITQTPDGSSIDHGVRRSPFTLSGNHRIVMENDNIPTTIPALIKNMCFQETVGPIFTNAFGSDFFTKALYVRQYGPSLLTRNSGKVCHKRSPIYGPYASSVRRISLALSKTSSLRKPWPSPCSKRSRTGRLTSKSFTT